MTIRIAVSGKGGVGKTTISALLVRELVANDCSPVLAVDADPNDTLAFALGAELPGSIADIREKVLSEKENMSPGVSKVNILQQAVQEQLYEGVGFDLLAMGRPEGPGCYCYVNSLLRKFMDDLNRKYAAVVVDNEAGMEHLSRRTTHDIETLILVSEPTAVGLKTVERIMQMSLDLPIKVGKRGLIINRISPQGLPENLDRLATAIGADWIEKIAENEIIKRCAVSGDSLPEGKSEIPEIADLLDKVLQK